MKQTKLNIVTKTDNYPIIIGSNLTSSVSKIFKFNSIDFPEPKKEIEKIIPNENFKIVK